MKVKITDATGIPPYHEYKNALVLVLDIECECGAKDRKVYLLDKKGVNKCLTHQS